MAKGYTTDFCTFFKEGKTMATNNEYTFSRVWAQFKASNAFSWACLGRCTLEESYRYFADKPQSSALPTIIYELRENPKFKKYSRAIDILCNLIHGEVHIETDAESKVKFYSIKLDENITPKQVRAILDTYKKRFRTDFLNFVMSFRNEETQKPKNKFDEARIIELVTALAKRCKKNGFTNYEEALLGILPSKAEKEKGEAQA